MKAQTIIRNRSFLFVLLVFLVLLAPPVQSTGAASDWQVTGSMSQARYNHTATLLNDGRVLVTGGEDNTGHFSSSELYDPATGRWFKTSDLHLARSSHTATLLQNGQVLVVGGCVTVSWIVKNPCWQPTETAELFNPSNGLWTQVASMYKGRYSHTATLLQNGKVLVAGGVAGTYPFTEATNTAEVYDPETNTWTRIASMNDARLVHTATLLSNGNVLVVGGCTITHGNQCQALASAELYNPSTNTWYKTNGQPQQARAHHTATLVKWQGFDMVWIVGGKNNDLSFNSVEGYFDPIGKFSLDTPMHDARAMHRATLISGSGIPNSRILVTGGQRGNEDTNVPYLATAEIFSPEDEMWFRVSDMTEPRWLHTATLLQNGRVLVAGGQWSYLSTQSSAELSVPYGTLPPRQFFKVFLPLVLCQPSSTPAPDLSVQAINVVNSNIQVILQNTGNAPVTNDFWVDLYINPTTIPTRVNQIWQQIAPYGAVWGVLGSLTPLNPGETLTLNIGDAYYWHSLSNLPNTLPANTRLFAQADSYNPATAYGTVLERDELGCGATYNNISSTQLATSVTPARVAPRQPASSNRLPKR